MMVSAGEPTEWVAEQMGHMDGRLVAAVYGRWLRRADLEPGEQAAVAYAEEWKSMLGQVETVSKADDVPDERLDVDGTDNRELGGVEDGDEGEF